MRLSKNDQELISEAYSKMLENEASPQTKLAKVHGENVWMLEPPLKTTRNTYPDSNLVRKGEMKQEPVTVEDLFLDRDEKGNVIAIDAEDATRSTVVNLPLPQEFDPKASFEEVLKALGYTVTEKDGQQQLPFKEAKEQTYTIRRTPYTKSPRPSEEINSYNLINIINMKNKDQRLLEEAYLKVNEDFNSERRVRAFAQNLQSRGFQEAYKSDSDAGRIHVFHNPKTGELIFLEVDASSNFADGYILTTDQAGKIIKHLERSLEGSANLKDMLTSIESSVKGEIMASEMWNPKSFEDIIGQIGRRDRIHAEVR